MLQGFQALARYGAKAWAPAGLVLLAGCATTGVDAPGAAPTAQRAPSKPAFLQSDIVGLDGKSLDTLLGAPALTRREGSGEYRRYAFSRCEVIVILYPDQSGKSAVRSIDSAAKMSGEAKPDLDECLAFGRSGR